MIQQMLADLFKWRRRKRPSAVEMVYYDRNGDPISIPADHLGIAQTADEINEGGEMIDLGSTSMFGPYTSAQLRSLIHIAQNSDGEDDAMLSIVAHTHWRDQDTGEAIDPEPMSPS